MEKISFIIPSRDNLRYLKWAYEGLRKNCSQEHQICMADDASTDGTWEWMVEEKKKNKNLSIYRNFGPDRLGLTVLYDYLAEELATNDVIMFFHADMYPSKDMDKKILDRLERGTVVSATRIEPPLHPDGPEKIISPLGFEPEEFDEEKFNKDVELYTKSEYTEGVFAPWALYKEDYFDVNGHDQLFIPQSREDSDIFNRFYLNGYQFRQIWDGFVYHLTSRGSRFRDGVGKDSDEWKYSNSRNMRNFIRKWGTTPMHDAMMKPIVLPKYNIGLVVTNCNVELLRALEPWCSNIYGDWIGHDKKPSDAIGIGVHKYIKDEQEKTEYDLEKKIDYLTLEPDNDIIVRFDGSKVTNENINFVSQLPMILQEHNEVGNFAHDIFEVTINTLEHKTKDLIKSKPLKSYDFKL
jgi:glycosyltransferase involved in cell wall biosynthesis